MKTAMSDEEYWERCANMGMSPDKLINLQIENGAAQIASRMADGMVAERSARLKKQHGMQEE